MESVQKFLHMGGYAFYVWTSYALGLVVLVMNVIMPRKREKEFLQRLQKRRKSGPGT